MFDFLDGLKFGIGCILALGAGTLILPISVATGVRIAQQIGVMECTMPKFRIKNDGSN